MSRIVITTSGSLGDLFPFLAIGLELQRRGHHVIIGTGACYRQRVESLGLGFHAIRPDSDWLSDPDQVRRLSHPRLGLIRVGREWLMPAIRDSYQDTLAAAENADLLVTMLANYATRLVAEKNSMPWVSAVRIPMAFFSSHDPPLLEIAPWLSQQLRFLGHSFWGPLFWCGKRASRFLARPWYRLRSELGLPAPHDGNPLVDSHAPELVLALFSPQLAESQADWPVQTVLTGFPFFDQGGEQGLAARLQRFLDEGTPPQQEKTEGTDRTGPKIANRIYSLVLQLARLVLQLAWSDSLLMAPTQVGRGRCCAGRDHATGRQPSNLCHRE